MKFRTLLKRTVVTAATCLGGLLLLAGAFSLAPTPAECEALPPTGTAESTAESSTANGFANCRYGLALNNTEAGSYPWASELGVGWYLDFGLVGPAPSPASSPQLGYLPIIFYKQHICGETNCNLPAPTLDCSQITTTPVWTVNNADLAWQIDNHRGRVWVIGNEPEREGQDEMCPQQYARAFHDAYVFIKGVDPTARLAYGGMIEATPMRLSYLDQAWTYYQQTYGVNMPVDVWTIHSYIIPETSDGDASWAIGTDPALAKRWCGDSSIPPGTPCYFNRDLDSVTILEAQIRAFRSWMATHGQRNKALILSEYNIVRPYSYGFPNFCQYQNIAAGGCTADPLPTGCGCFWDEDQRSFYPERVAAYMTAGFQGVLNSTDATIGNPMDGGRLVQQWNWYKATTPDQWQLAAASNLITAGQALTTTNLTPAGQAWRSYVTAIPPSVNLLLSNVASPNVIATANTTVTLSASVMNNGNQAVTRPFSVTFYSDADRTQKVAEGRITAGVGGCAVPEVQVTAEWPNLAPRNEPYPFWVRIDSVGTIVSDTVATDGLGQGTVRIWPTGLYLPLVRKYTGATTGASTAVPATSATGAAPASPSNLPNTPLGGPVFGIPTATPRPR
jgi:hypothetical protein